MGKFKTWLQNKWEMQVLNMITRKWGIINPFPHPHAIWSNFEIQISNCIWESIFLISDVVLIPRFHFHNYMANLMKTQELFFSSLGFNLTIIEVHCWKCRSCSEPIPLCVNRTCIIEEYAGVAINQIWRKICRGHLKRGKRQFEKLRFSFPNWNLKIEQSIKETLQAREELLS